MKKILFALACVATLTLASCFENAGYSRTDYFVRVVTIDTTSTSVELVADYTNETFTSKNITNLKYPEQLSQFGLSGARRAEVLMMLHTDASYNQTLTLEKAQKIAVQPISNTTPTGSLSHLSSLMQKPLFSNYAPVVWVANGYLNVVPVIPSSQAGIYYLTAEKAINDTLYFRLDATYVPNDGRQDLEDQLQCFDLRTLTDTISADSVQRANMIEVLNAIKQHKNDSMRIVLTSSFDWKKINGKDTIGDIKVSTDYFKCEFIQ